MRSGPLKSDRDTFVALAEKLVPVHATYLALGFRLVIRPDFRTDGCGHITARFVYRGGETTITHTVKRLQVEWT